MENNRRRNPIKGLFKNIKKIKKPLPSYGLGAYPPPKEIMPIIKPGIGDIAVTGTWNQELNNSSFFENLLMVIIIIFLLKWLFGFNFYNY